MRRLPFRLFLLLLLLPAFAACDSSDSDGNGNDDGGGGSVDCNASGTGIVAANVDGEAFCAFTSSASDESGDVVLFAVGSYSGSSGAGLSITAPGAEGTYTVSSSQSDVFASFAPTADGIVYDTGSDGGSGTVVISDISETRVEGTFSFVMEGFDENTDMYTGETLSVTSGEFDVPLIEF